MPRKQAGEPSVPEAARPAYDAIVGLTDRLCQAHLTHEYQMLCRKLAAALARKRPSPLTRGKPEVWACPVLRVIGWGKFLDDSSTLILDGWGIHYNIRGGWVWNLWGRDCVVVHLMNGGVLWIGTDNAENLSRLLEGKIKQQQP